MGFKFCVVYFGWGFNVQNYNIEIDRSNFYGQSINNHRTNNLIKQYDELRKKSTGQGDDYTTGCLLDLQL